VGVRYRRQLHAPARRVDQLRDIRNLSQQRAIFTMDISPMKNIHLIM